MAEATVEAPITSRFFCHRCNVEIRQVLPGFKCPRCNTGFIEELDYQPETSFSEDSSEGEDTVEMATSIRELLSQGILNGIQGGSLIMGTSNSTPSEGGTQDSTTVPGGSNSRRRRSAGIFSHPTRSTRRRTSNDRQTAPLENILQEFIVNLSGFDWDTVGIPGSPMFMYGNPGDYAWGRAGLDAIITQLLNQMDGTGPPPMAKEKIAQIPTVVVEQQQVDKNMQCSVCWEDFKLGESVRKLVCEHLYHTQCIVPWLQLHGTCPVCRKALNDELDSENPNSINPGPSTSSASQTASNSSTSWLSSVSQSGPRMLSSFLGSVFGGGSSPSTSSSSSSSSRSSNSNSSTQQMDREEGSSHRHSYNLRSRENRTENNDDDESDDHFSSHSSRYSRGGRYHFEDDYD